MANKISFGHKIPPIPLHILLTNCLHSVINAQRHRELIQSEVCSDVFAEYLASLTVVLFCLKETEQNKSRNFFKPHEHF